MNPNHHYFDGFYQSIWQQIIPEALTEREVQHMIQFHALDRSTPVLDLMCGYGRHAIALARNGIPVTAVDNQANYIRRVEAAKQSESLPIRSQLVNVLDWTPVPGHQLAICLGNSLNFFAPSELPVFLRKVFDGLADGGHFWINSWSVAEIILRDPMDGQSQTSTIGSFTHTNTFHLRHDPARLEIDSSIRDASGSVENRLAIDYIYTIPELKAYLAAAGLTTLSVQSIPGKKDFAEGDSRAYILTQKVKP